MKNRIITSILLLCAVFSFQSCEKNPNEYDPNKIIGKNDDNKKKDNKSFAVEFKEDSRFPGYKTIHVKLSDVVSYDAFFDTGRTGILSISIQELNSLIKAGVVGEQNRGKVVPMQLADGSVVPNVEYYIKSITLVDIQGKPHTINDVIVSVDENQDAPIIFGSGAIDQFAKNSYEVDLNKKQIIFK